MLHTAADGNGPVNALDRPCARRSGAFYPGSTCVHLVDYKVRILDGASATAAKTRVRHRVEQPGGHVEHHGSRDTNIIAASWQALGDSLEYALWKGEARLTRRDERHFTTIQGGRP